MRRSSKRSFLACCSGSSRSILDFLHHGHIYSDVSSRRVSLLLSLLPWFRRDPECLAGVEGPVRQRTRLRSWGGGSGFTRFVHSFFVSSPGLGLSILHLSTE